MVLSVLMDVKFLTAQAEVYTMYVMYVCTHTHDHSTCVWCTCTHTQDYSICRALAFTRESLFNQWMTYCHTINGDDTWTGALVAWGRMPCAFFLESLISDTLTSLHLRWSRRLCQIRFTWVIPSGQTSDELAKPPSVTAVSLEAWKYPAYLVTECIIIMIFSPWLVSRRY